MKTLALAAGIFLAVGAPAAFAQEDCGLCDTEVVMNAPTAKCFLDQYSDLEQRSGTAVVVDLSACKVPEIKERGVIEALPNPLQAIPMAPSTEFMLSRAQLGCLREKLDDPALVLDPSATIKLDACDGKATGKTN